MPDTKIDEIVVEPEIVEELPDIKNLPKESPFETKEEKEDNVDYNMLTAKKIKELLKSKGFRGYSKLTKPNLIRLLNGEKIEDLVKPKKIKKVVEPETVVEPVVETVEPEPVVEPVEEPVVEEPEPVVEVIQALEEEPEPETDVEEEPEPEPPKPKKIRKKPIVKTTIKKEVSKPKIVKKVEVVDRRPDYNPFKQYYLIN